MNFSFDYDIAGTITTVVVTVEDAIIAEAQKIGVDISVVEAEAKTAIDNLVAKVTNKSFWGKIVDAVQTVETDVVDFVENLVAPINPADPTDPTPPAPPAPPAQS